tara:strand:+ start:8857 stop:9354 length:498 start_codon:yes stop_codon:yes gene_type:complete
VKKMSERSKRKMNRAQLMAKKGYQKLNFDTNIKKQDLPAVVVNNLRAYLEKGLLQQTRKGYYRKPQNFGLEDKEVETNPAQDEEEEPSWVSAAKDAVAEEPVEESKNSVWDEAKLATGQKAVNIVQLVDGLLTGELGLSALTQIKQEAVLILDDFGLIQKAEESS